MPTLRRIEKMRQVLQNRQPDLAVVCENIHDPHNVSAILRTCDAVGVDTVYLLYTNTPFPKIGKKSSASAKKWVNLKRFDNALELRDHLKSQGFTIYATHLSEEAQSIFSIDWTQRSAIVMGNEHEGVSREILEIADEQIYIPMLGMVQSLNVSVATAVILYEACRQRLLNDFYPHPTATKDSIEKRLEEWKKK
ncbi:MAG: RNA methyltransferase [Calditrichaeota bacterium]|nr:MAG: RNA methyltransferase [Calditrichota bacterium]